MAGALQRGEAGAPERISQNGRPAKPAAADAASAGGPTLKIRSRRPTIRQRAIPPADRGSMNNLSAAERDRIEVGKPLPFSVFTAEGKLLLAAGQVVASERLRELLLKTGQSRALIDTGLMADPLSSTRTSRQA